MFVKYSENPKVDTNDPQVVKNLIAKNDIKVFICNDCEKSFSHQYLLNNHYKSTTKCKFPEDKP